MNMPMWGAGGGDSMTPGGLTHPSEEVSPFTHIVLETDPRIASPFVAPLDLWRAKAPGSQPLRSKEKQVWKHSDKLR